MPRTFFHEGRRLVLRVFGVLGTRAVIAVCLLVAVSVAIGAWRNLRMIARGISVEGVVVRQADELSADWDGSGAAKPEEPRMAAARRVYRAVVAFESGGRAFEVLSKRLGPVHFYPLGSKQIVVFTPDRPQEARLRAELPDVWTQATLLLMGTVVGSAAVQWWWWLARRRPRFRRRPGVSHPVGTSL